MKSASGKTPAKSLIHQAIIASKESTADLLIAAAKSLDPSIDAAKVKTTWTEKFLSDHKNRTGNPQ